MQRLTTFSLAFFSVSLLVYILFAAQAFFVPILIALIIAYFIITLAEGLGRLSILGRKLPHTLAFIGSICIFLGAIYLVFTLVSNNVAALLESAPIYQEKLRNLIHDIFDSFGKPPPALSEAFERFDFGSLLTQFVLMLTEVARIAGMIAIYVIFLLIEYHYFDSKLMAIFRSDKGKESARKIIRKITEQIQSYLVIKTILSTLTALCSYFVLGVAGVDFSGFWALLIFFLNYIPTIGSIVATVLPCLLTLLQFGSLFPFLIVSIGLITIQVVIGNILEPRIMGKQFNLSGLVIILSLTIWGMIWGVVGMFLCVPLLMIISIILSNFPQTRTIAILLSQSGTLKE